MYRTARTLILPLLLLGMLAALPACGDDDGGLPKAGVDCDDLSPMPAVISDIDETLTTSDNEFLMQVMDAEYVPASRPGSVELMQGFYERGYLILYLTARYETLELLDGSSAREATESWLLDEGYPVDPDRTRVVLAADSNSGDETIAYKRGALEDLMAEGWDFEYAFGNADTDIAAYAEAGIPLDVTYIIGDHAGEEGTVAVAGEGWTDTIATLLDPVGRTCDF